MLTVAIKLCEKGTESAAAMGLLETVCKESGVVFGKKKICRTKKGKPCFADGSPKFSIAHTAGVACCAVQCEHPSDLSKYKDIVTYTLESDPDSEVGIDIEAADRKVTSPTTLAFRRFSGAERKAAKTERDIIFIWTRKEALLKYTGEGLSGLRSCDSCALPYGTETDTRTIELTGREYFISVCRKTK